jgi:hypothetical protein
MSLIKWDTDENGQDPSVPSINHMANYDMLTTANRNGHTPEPLRFIKTSADMARTLEAMKQEKAKTQSDGATTHGTDHTFPLFEEDKARMAAQICEAIKDWTQFIEWMQVLPKHDKKRYEEWLFSEVTKARNVAKGKGRLLTVDMLDPPPDVKQRFLCDSNLDQNQKKILSRPVLAETSVELLS